MKILMGSKGDGPESNVRVREKRSLPMRRMSLFIGVLLLAHCYPNIEPAHARPLNCKTTCRTDSGGHSICRTSCW